MQSQILKQNIKLSLFIGLTSILFTGCANNSTMPSSGSYDADTFREKYDPDPNVDYSLQKKKKKKKLNIASGTYDAATFREKYDPDPNVDYSYGKSSSSSSSSSGFWAGVGAVIKGTSNYYNNRDSSYPLYNPSIKKQKIISSRYSSGRYSGSKQESGTWNSLYSGNDGDRVYKTGGGYSTVNNGSISNFNGSSSTRRGNIIQYSNGTIGTINGNTVYRNDGGSSTINGNYIYHSDGTSSYIQ